MRLGGKQPGRPEVLALWQALRSRQAFTEAIRPLPCQAARLPTSQLGFQQPAPAAAARSSASCARSSLAARFSSFSRPCSFWYLSAKSQTSGEQVRGGGWVA